MKLPPALADLVEGRRWTKSMAGEAGADVFHLEAPGRPGLYLKYGQGPGIAADVRGEGMRLFWAAGRMAVPEVRQLVAAPDEAWLLSTEIPGDTGDTLLARAPGQINVVIDAAADFLRQLHDLPVSECPFDAGATLRCAAAKVRIEAGRVDEDDFAPDHAGWSAQDVWTELRALADFTPEPVVAHGDYSLGNILFENGRAIGCIDVGRLGVADRYQDLAIFWENLAEYGPEAQARFLSAYGIDAPDMRRLRFHRCLDELF